MSPPHIILEDLPSLCQNCQIWWKFDVVITKIILLVFLRHDVHAKRKTPYIQGGPAKVRPTYILLLALGT